MHTITLRASHFELDSKIAIFRSSWPFDYMYRPSTYFCESIIGDCNASSQREERLGEAFRFGTSICNINERNFVPACEWRWGVVNCCQRAQKRLNHILGKHRVNWPKLDDHMSFLSMSVPRDIQAFLDRYGDDTNPEHDTQWNDASGSKNWEFYAEIPVGRDQEPRRCMPDRLRITELHREYAFVILPIIVILIFGLVGGDGTEYWKINTDIFESSPYFSCTLTADIALIEWIFPIREEGESHICLRLLGTGH
jgi:hypothetical protein